MHRTILLALVTCVVFSVVAYMAGQAIADAAADTAALKKEYRDRSAKIDDKKAGAADERLRLAQWAQDKGLLEDARTELKRSLKLNPNNERAERLLILVEADIQSARDGKASAADPDAAVPATGGAGTAGTSDARGLVSDQDINKIKWTELRKADGKSVAVDFKTVKYKSNGKDKTAKANQQYIDSQLGQAGFDKDRFARLSLAEQLIEMRETPGHGGVNIHGDITIKNDPKFMRDFRALWPNVNQSCASAKCHGGAKGKGELKLFPRSGTNDKVDYTNFLILSLWEKGGRRLIDRDRPEDSLLLQYGLPRDKAKHKHPAAQDWKPVFPDTKGNYAKFEQFIRELEGTRTPNYGTDYQPPVGRKLRGGATGSFSGLVDDEASDE